ncbi:hypothetical protein VMCG_06213 [Cytospora schulzeri]|uniref:Uncharacterized protein n=1 Tax=Cytospora schulzeri TaxID=448051 RepID=A0A423W9C9_9PEZI|nr:hypothetical protein VMCG_06213 [Valsa malicola]
MNSAQETVQAVQKALGPFIRPREETEHIRRVLALHLRSSQENGPQPGHLALAEPDCTIKSTSDVRGLQREYLKALHANVKAQKEYQAVSQKHQQTKNEDEVSGPSNLNDAGRLEEHVTTIKLKRKRERLQTIEKYLDLLSQKPAASLEYLQPREIFEDARRLPEVPQSVVHGFAVDNESTKTDLKALVDRLEKAVLRSKLLLRKEEQLLEEVKSRSTASPGQVSDGAKLAALSTTRNELISWMETELSKASEGEEPQPNEGDAGGRRGKNVDKEHMDEHLVQIKEKYASYVAARKELVQLVGQSPQLSIKPPQGDKDTARPGTAIPAAPSTHLITPYIENLLSLALEQKASIAQKSHLDHFFSRQTEESVRALDHLAEESQLLPAHPVPGASRRGHGSGKGTHEIADRVQPWVSAADSAKLATLEEVAEKIEGGQVALEGSTRYLAEVDHLLGRNANQGDESADEDTTVDDIWLAESQTPRKGSTAGMRARSKSNPVKEKKDIWSTLEGSLGLINAEDSPRK